MNVVKTVLMFILIISYNITSTIQSLEYGVIVLADIGIYFFYFI